VSKESFALSKWLILRAREHIDAGVDVRAADSDLSGRNRPAPLRSPTGQPGLPCDWLFSVAVEAVIIVEATTQRIVQANPAAAKLMGTSQAALIGTRFLDALDRSSSEVVARSMEGALATGVGDPVTCKSSGGGAEVRVKASMFRAENQQFLLLNLASMTDDVTPIDSQSPVFDAIDNSSVGFLLTDSGLRIEYANQALVDMVELSPPAEMRGKSLARWLEFSPADLARLREQMLQRQATSVMTAHLRTERGSPLEVEVCAVAVPDGTVTCWGFTVRELPRLN
jgi:PAS domain S-box-containing protein